MTAARPGDFRVAEPASASPASAVPGRLYRPALWFALISTTGLAVCYQREVSIEGKGILGLGLVFTLVAAYVALAHPRRFPLLLIAYLPYNACFPINVGGSTSLNLTNVLFLLGVVAMLSARPQRRQPFGGLEYLLVAFLAFACLAFLTAVFADAGQDLQTETFRFKRWLTPFLIFFLVRRVTEDRDDVVDVVVALLWTSTLVGALTWWEGRESSGGSIDTSRVGAVIGQANAMAAFLVYYSLPALALFLRMKTRAARALCLAGFLIMVRGMLFTMSRGAYLALAAGVGVVTLLRSPVLLVASILAGGAATQYAPGLVPSSVVTRLQETHKADSLDPDPRDNLDKSSRQRLMLWDAATGMIRDHPWRGVGLNRFSEVVGAYTETPLGEDDPSDAHNAYIKVAAEMGIPALLTMILLLTWIAGSALALYLRRTDLFERSLALALIGSLTGLVVSCLFGSRFTDENLMSHFWILVGSVRVLGFFPAAREPIGPPA
jgi:hypothetical protein